MLRTLALLLVAVGFLPVTARAAIIVSATTLPSETGRSGFVEVRVTNTPGSNAVDISGYSFDIRLDAPGARFTTADAQTASPYLFGTLGLGQQALPDLPAAVFNLSDLSADPLGFVTLQPGQTRGLARLGYDLGSLAVGTVPIRFGSNLGTTAIFDGVGAPYRRLAANDSLNLARTRFDGTAIQSIPEPATASLLGLIAVAGLATRRRMKRPRA